MIDENLVYDKDQDNKKGYSFLEDQKKEIDEKIKEGNDITFMPIEEFRDKTGQIVPHANLPYETIDVKIILLIFS